jgi:signal transduction histidine kinase
MNRRRAWRTVTGVTLGDPRARLRDLPPRDVDAALVAAVAAAMTLSIAIADEPEATRSPDVFAYVIGAAVAGLLLLRRRRPLAVLGGSLALLLFYYSLGYPAFSPSVPLAAATYSAAAAGRTAGAAAMLGAFMVIGGLGARVAEGEPLDFVLRANWLSDIALLSAVLLLGEAVRNRRAWAEEVRGRMRRAEQDREREAARRVEQERLRIAREMHDVLAHTIAAISVQAGVAADVIDEEPEKARASLRAIRQQSRDAMSELKATVGVLRAASPDALRAPAPGLAQLAGLVEMGAGAGLRVDVSVAGEARPLPGAVDLTAYRIVQESLTNVVRHADATSATVSVRYGPDTVVLDVYDDGRAAANGGPAEHGGHGLIGMRERAAAIGGTLQAETEPGGGFRVHATLPIRGAAA